MQNPILISACLTGEACRYDGKPQKIHPLIQSWENQGRLVKICPEVQGGLSTPRPPCEIINGTGYDVLQRKSIVCTKAGKDCTEQFLAGACHALETAIAHKASMAILKEKSPSCGTFFIYDGSFSGRLIKGPGVTAALLQSHGIHIFSENQLERLRKTT